MSFFACVWYWSKPKVSERNQVTPLLYCDSWVTDYIFLISNLSEYITKVTLPPWTCEALNCVHLDWLTAAWRMPGSQEYEKF